MKMTPSPQSPPLKGWEDIMVPRPLGAGEGYMI